MNRIMENGWKLQQRFYPNRAIYEKGNERRVINTLNGELMAEYKVPAWDIKDGQGGSQTGQNNKPNGAGAPPARQES